MMMGEDTAAPCKSPTFACARQLVQATLLRSTDVHANGRLLKAAEVARLPLASSVCKLVERPRVVTKH